jgi:hypothetical protein
MISCGDNIYFYPLESLSALPASRQATDRLGPISLESLIFLHKNMASFQKKSDAEKGKNDNYKSYN